MTQIYFHSIWIKKFLIYDEIRLTGCVAAEVCMDIIDEIDMTASVFHTDSVLR